MWVRMTTLQGARQSLEDGARMINEDVIPHAKELAGFVGGYWFGDRESGKVVGFTLWDSLEHLRDSEEAASKLRQQAAQQAGGMIASVEIFELIAQA